jgi:hypothetical protein
MEYTFLLLMYFSYISNDILVTAEISAMHSNTFLFLGDPDENVYVIQNGKVNVFITGSDGTAISLKCVKTGESITSLLSFTDVLTVSESDKNELFLKMCKNTFSSMNRIF